MAARIVVIDNDAGIREFLAFGLKDEGYQVSTYAYAAINLAALDQLMPDLIILDFNVRDGGIGWELLQLLKMDDTTANIAILITTTLVDVSAELRDYLFTRFIRVVDKPFDLDIFLPLVKKTLELAGQAGTLFSSDRRLPILVVEDTEDLRETLTTILRLEGYPVVTADNGLLALDAVSRADYCLILLDIAMPVMDGFEFLAAYDQQLRPHTPVIITSGEPDSVVKALPSFVIGVLRKPYGISNLLALVKKYAQPV